MANPFWNAIHPGVFQIGLVLFLSFLVGLQREEHKSEAGRYVFGGVRTYPLIGLTGYSLAYLSDQQPIALTVGFAAIAGLMMLTYWHKTQAFQEAGITSEMAGLTTYLVGALVFHGYYWVASTIVVASLMLLELKSVLEGLVHRFSEDDILNFAKFLLLTIVILPILPNQSFGSFQLNPFKTWLVVVAVSTISYASFLLQRVLKGRGDIAVIALLGGAYSSTVTTVALAKQSAQDPRSHTFAGGILMASGVMYLRLALLTSLFNPNLAQLLALPFGLLAITALVSGALWSVRAEPVTAAPTPHAAYTTRNPLELKAAFLFALLFVGIVIVTHYAADYLGNSGLFILAAVLGVTDVDPFILGMTQVAGHSTPLSTAGIAILIAAASNNFVKGLYAKGFGDHAAGQQSLRLLVGLAVLGLIPCLFL